MKNTVLLAAALAAAGSWADVDRLWWSPGQGARIKKTPASKDAQSELIARAQAKRERRKAKNAVRAP